MSNNISLDFGFDMGEIDTANDANLSYVKIKAGKGAEDALAIKQVVESGSGKTLADEDHYISIKVPVGADVEELKEMVNGFSGGDDELVEEIEGSDGYKWIMVSLKKVNEGAEMGDIAEAEKELSEFFGLVQNNAFLEMFMKSNQHWTEAKTIAEQNNEREAEGPTGDTLPSLANFLKGFSAHIKADIDHDFCVQVANFCKKFCPITPELFEFCRKMNNVEMALHLESIDKLTGSVKQDIANNGWETLVECREMFEDMKSFATALDDIRVFFVLKDNAYFSLEVKCPGLADYVRYFAPDEE